MKRSSQKGSEREEPKEQRLKVPSRMGPSFSRGEKGWGKEGGIFIQFLT